MLPENPVHAGKIEPVRCASLIPGSLEGGKHDGGADTKDVGKASCRRKLHLKPEKELGFLNKGIPIPINRRGIKTGTIVRLQEISNVRKE